MIWAEETMDLDAEQFEPLPEHLPGRGKNPNLYGPNGQRMYRAERRELIKAWKKKIKKARARAANAQNASVPSILG